MSRIPCSQISEAHRRAVSEGVRKAWQRRYAEGFKPKGPTGQIGEIARMFGCKPENAVEFTRLVDEQYRTMCAKLQECVHRHNLGLGGEDVADLVIHELDKLKGVKIVPKTG